MLRRILSWLQQYIGRSRLEEQAQAATPPPVTRDSNREDVDPYSGDPPFLIIDNPPGEITMPPKPHIIIGRGKNTTDIDLTPFDAEELGVSRRHAMVLYREAAYFVRDEDSTNGTFLNGQRLPPGRMYILRDGDRLEFGALRMRFRLLRDNDPVERLSYYRLSVILSQRHGRTWSTNYRIWYAILRIARDYGWHPTVWPPSGTPMRTEDTLALAQALERALLDLPEDAPRAMVRGFFESDTLMSPLSFPALYYLDEPAGRQKVMELIAFLRHGPLTFNLSGDIAHAVHAMRSMTKLYS